MIVEAMDDLKILLKPKPFAGDEEQWTDWSFQIKCESFVIFTDNYHNLRLLNIV